MSQTGRVHVDPTHRGGRSLGTLPRDVKIDTMLPAIDMVNSVPSANGESLWMCGIRGQLGRVSQLSSPENLKIPGSSVFSPLVLSKSVFASNDAESFSPPGGITFL